MVPGSYTGTHKIVVNLAQWGHEREIWNGHYLNSRLLLGAWNESLNWKDSDHPPLKNGLHAWPSNLLLHFYCPFELFQAASSTCRKWNKWRFCDKSSWDNGAVTWPNKNHNGACWSKSTYFTYGSSLISIWVAESTDIHTQRVIMKESSTGNLSKKCKQLGIFPWAEKEREREHQLLTLLLGWWSVSTNISASHFRKQENPLAHVFGNWDFLARYSAQFFRHNSRPLGSVLRWSEHFDMTKLNRGPKLGQFNQKKLDLSSLLHILKLILAPFEILIEELWHPNSTRNWDLISNWLGSLNKPSFIHKTL